jgi:hypothetical protein
MANLVKKFPKKSFAAAFLFFSLSGETRLSLLNMANLFSKTIP